ncbi:hypothetical protein PPERSA_05830 [Pseudocohnilembus persalinus]|uniref:Calcium uniporter protein C-terminal domain-containing protein n=1 Tax=Pseudocohnilembus persalinus TaxID=266149 RepID=A0A0V0QGB7_PSEPJ|nr:hypothetical protein PPERSA_05830 [Pseudocohnilembus persalinus]|eukprot:KRX01244.1 hypothetical protein PPERSA_05830 [Pseudocohnilembus persalinus]
MISKISKNFLNYKKHFQKKYNTLINQQFYFSTSNLNFDIQGCIPLKQPIQDTYQIKVKSCTFYLEPEQTIQELIEQTQNKEYTITKIFRFDSEKLAEFQENTKIQDILKQDFIVQVNGNDNYQVLKTLDDCLGLEASHQNQEIGLESYKLEELGEQLNFTHQKNKILGQYASKYIQEITQVPQNTISKGYLNILNEKILMEISLSSKSKLDYINRLEKILEKQQTQLQSDQDQIKNILENKSNSRLRAILLFYMSQIAFTQYGTYFLFSWDIMEPITCMLGVLDLIIAYTYWLSYNTDFSFKQVATDYVGKRLPKKLKQENLHIDELQEIQKMLEYLNYQKLQHAFELGQVIKSLKESQE